MSNEDKTKSNLALESSSSFSSDGDMMDIDNVMNDDNNNNDNDQDDDDEDVINDDNENDIFYYNHEATFMLTQQPEGGFGAENSEDSIDGDSFEYNDYNNDEYNDDDNDDDHLTEVGLDNDHDRDQVEIQNDKEQEQEDDDEEKMVENEENDIKQHNDDDHKHVTFGQNVMIGVSGFTEDSSCCDEDENETKGNEDVDAALEHNVKDDNDNNIDDNIDIINDIPSNSHPQNGTNVLLLHNNSIGFTEDSQEVTIEEHQKVAEHEEHEELVEHKEHDDQAPKDDNHIELDKQPSSDIQSLQQYHKQDQQEEKPETIDQQEDTGKDNMLSEEEEEEEEEEDQEDQEDQNDKKEFCHDDEQVMKTQLENVPENSASLIDSKDFVEAIEPDAECILDEQQSNGVVKANNYIDDQQNADQEDMDDADKKDVQKSQQSSHESSMTPVSIYNGITQSLPTQLPFGMTEHSEKDSSSASQQAQLPSVNEIVKDSQHEDLGSVNFTDDSRYNAATVPLGTPAESNEVVSSPKPSADQDVSSQLNESEETKTITGDDLTSPFQVFTNTPGENCSDGQNSCESTDVKSKTNQSLLGPTPSQSNDTLSYPSDYLMDCLKINKCSKPNKVTPGCKSIDDLEEANDMDNDHTPETQDVPSNSISQTELTSQNLLVIPQEKSNVDNAKKSIESPIRDVIDDSDEEKDTSLKDNVSSNLNCRGGSGSSFTFLPPSPGKRQDHLNSLAHNHHSLTKKRKIDNTDGRSYVQEVLDDIVEDPSQIDPMIMEYSVSKAHTGKVEESTLKDTQPDDVGEMDNRNLTRISRGLSSRSASAEELNTTTTFEDNNDIAGNDSSYHSDHTGETSSYQNSTQQTEQEWSDDDEEDEEEEDNDGSNEDYGIPLSQNTNDIKSMLHSLKKTNVNKLLKNLEKHPSANLKNAHDKIDCLTKRNKKLELVNKRLMKEKKELQQHLTEIRTRLLEKNKLCKQMKSQLHELQPLIDAVQAIDATRDSKKQNINSSSKKSRKAKYSSPINKNSDVDSDRESENERTETSDDEQKPRRLNFVTPRSNRRTRGSKNGAIVTTSDKKGGKKKMAEGDVTFQELWKLLQEHGWKYKQGPEPYGSVYVPPEGRVTIGSVLGTDFFHADDLLWKHAEKLGIIDSNTNAEVDSGSDEENIANITKSGSASCSDKDDKVHVNLRKKRSSVSCAKSDTPTNCEANARDDLKEVKIFEDELDDTELCGSSFALTQRSAWKCSSLVKNFLTKNESDRNFTKDLWIPMWTCIKDEQGSSVDSCGWRYEPSRGAGTLGRKYWYCPPKSLLGSKGIFGKDYFTNEEAVVSFLLRDLKTIDICAIVGTDIEQLVIDFEMRLSRAIENHLPYNDSDLFSDGIKKRHRNRSRKAQLQDNHSSSTQEHPKGPLKISPSEKIVSTSVNQLEQNTILHSQKTMEGAEILMELTNSLKEKPSRTSSDLACVATTQGIKRLLDLRSRYSKKRKSPEKSPLANKPLKKKGKTTCESNMYHLTQAPEDAALIRWVSPATKNGGLKESLPLDGYSFFGSGVDSKIANTVSKLGGKFLKDVKGDDLIRMNVVKKLFFLAGVHNRRTHKYLLASALGVPMLHFDWVYALEDKYNEYKSQIQSSTKEGKCPSVFDSQLYSAYRLPLGFSIDSNLFVLQRASHAKKWRGLLTENGTLIFSGLAITVALDDNEAEKKWRKILELAGAKVFGRSEVEETTHIDLVIADSLSLPPHVTAIASKVSKILNKISSTNPDAPIVDLSWATQCIVNKKRIDIGHRYILHKNAHVTSDSDREVNIYAIKVKQSDSLLTRYEVGDTVSFGRKKAKKSYGRIKSMCIDKLTKKKKVKVEVMELHGDFELIDGGQGMSIITLEESELQGHIIILSGKDYAQSRWSDSSRVFIQKIKA